MHGLPKLMAKEYLIIDGYNLMHAAGMARASYGPGDLGRCRDSLLEFLRSHLSPIQQQRTIVVFDAREPPPGGKRQFHLGRMLVLFAEAPGDADAEIEELIAGHSAPKQVKLISSDHRLQNAASRRKARFLDSEDWIDKLEQRGEQQQSSSEAPPQELRQDAKLTDAETEYWLNVFEDVGDEKGNEKRSIQGDLPDIIDEDTFQ